MKTGQEIRMRLNTYKLIKKERTEKGTWDKIDEILYERSVFELEWMLE